MPALPALPAGAQTVVDKLSSVWDKAAPHLKASGRWLLAPLLRSCTRAPGRLQLMGARCWSMVHRPRVQQRVGCRRRCAAAARVSFTLPICSHASALLQTALHWGYIPAIILLGMTQTEPRPSWGQLLGPM